MQNFVIYAGDLPIHGVGVGHTTSVGRLTPYADEPAAKAGNTAVELLSGRIAPISLVDEVGTIWEPFFVIEQLLVSKGVRRIRYWYYSIVFPRV